jgi:shikimate dehydrogenase
MSGIQLFVNATSLGMLGKPELDISLADLPASAVVCDIVYVPLETELLRRARARGLRTVDGLGMLLHQACPAFEKWYGVAPAVTAELRELLIQDILHPSAP